MFHEDECDPNDNISSGAIILILDSIQAYDDVDFELEKGGSCGNVISLANWNECAAVRDEVSSPAYALVSVDHCDFIPIFPFDQHSHANNKRCCRSNKFGNMYIIMEVRDPS